MKSTTIAIDLAKNVFQVAISNKPGVIDSEHRLTRVKLLPFFAQQRPATVLLEACGSAHHWGRKLRELGHKPVLLPPFVVTPYRQGDKTDRNDARAMLEAYRNANIHPVPVKTIHQQSLTALHRLRSQWIQDRTARINGLRGILRELGLFIPVGAKNVVPAVWELLEDADSPIPATLRHPLAEACLEIRDFEQRVKAVEIQLKALAKQMPEVRRVQTVPGVGLLTATAMVAFIGDAKRFPTSRHFAAFLGLTPKETSSGGKRRMGRISKRGDGYLRTLLVQGASAVMLSAARAKQPDRFKQWALVTEKRIHRNKAACAIANKMARVIWAVWCSGNDYKPVPPKPNQLAA